MSLNCVVETDLKAISKTLFLSALGSLLMMGAQVAPVAAQRDVNADMARAQDFHPNIPDQEIIRPRQSPNPGQFRPNNPSANPIERNFSQSSRNLPGRDMPGRDMRFHSIERPSIVGPDMGLQRREHFQRDEFQNRDRAQRPGRERNFQGNPMISSDGSPVWDRHHANRGERDWRRGHDRQWRDHNRNRRYDRGNRAYFDDYWYGGPNYGWSDDSWYDTYPVMPLYVQPRYVEPNYAAPVYSRQERHRLSARHVKWCSARYRSYRASDNSFQPNHGPRRQCKSPF